jgi:hypothetical protein
MEIKRTPHRVLVWHKSDCVDVNKAVSRALKLLDREISDRMEAKDEAAVNQMVGERHTLHSLLVAAIEI